MALTLTDMQRELHFYAMAEMRNRGLEDAARMIDARSQQLKSQDRFELTQLAAKVRALKTNPEEHLSDWWGSKAPPITDESSPPAS